MNYGGWVDIEVIRGGLSENVAEIKVEILMFSERVFYADSKYVVISIC